MRAIIYATSNKYKLASANRALANTTLRLAVPDIDLPDIPEIQSDDQVAVSVDKAKKYYQLLKRPLVVMDSGLFVPALGGFPGVYTKYALETIGIKNIVRLLDIPEKRLAYTSRTVTYFDGETLKTFNSKVNGALVENPRGNNGRNYDQYFMPDGSDKTMAEMTDHEKTAIVADVWQELAEWLAD